MLRLFFLSVISVFVAGIAGFIGAVHFGGIEYRKPGPLTEKTIVNIPKGLGVLEISRLLAQKKVINDEILFESAVRVTNAGSELQAGEYSFPAQVSQQDVLRILTSGKVILHSITLPEGLTTIEALALLNTNIFLSGNQLRRDNIPFGEGILLPETYNFPRGYDRRQLFDRMTAAHKRALARLWENRGKNLPITTPEEAIILASIVEKETGLASERRHIAGVFTNRLRKGMKLQSDPTVIYAVTQGTGPLRRDITKTDLATKSPYNTYYIKGLPPGPICNPGIDSIRAVLHPLPTKDVFFVADGTGGHVFAETLKQHNANVREWRRIEEERKKLERKVKSGAQIQPVPQD